MKYAFPPYAIAQYVTAAVSVLMVFVLWKRRFERGGKALLLLFIALSVWTFCNGMEAAAIEQPLKLFWSKLAYVGAQTSPVFLFIFALTYSGRVEEISFKKIFPLFIIPLIVILLAATNEYHHWIWSSFDLGAPGTNSLIYHHGPAFWAGMVYVFTLVAFSTTLIVLTTVQSQRLYRFQNVILILASLIPWLSTVLYLTDLNPFPGLDIISLSFFFTGLLLLIGVERADLLSYIPVAYELIFENINDGILVFNENKKVIDMNPGAERMLGVKFSQIVANQSPVKLKHFDLYDDHFSKTENNRFEMLSPFNNQVWLNVSISPLRKRKGVFLGWVAIMEDITLRKKTEKELQRINQRLADQLEENRKLERQLRDQASRDALTGIFNRSCLKDSFETELSFAKQQDHPVSIVMIDVDNFKKINDTYGHKVGDEVLIVLGKLLLKNTRESDFVSRFGGDEFVLLLPNLGAEAAFQRAESWRNEFKNTEIPGLGKDFHATISIGIAVFPISAQSMDELLSEADGALYQAKQSGRDRTKIAASIIQ